ncbi:grasp-with-spasm system SPASM domain peptide maturase [Chitinophaga sp.]|uniref:grasp-with-spasm system SPASM domain peptide maturase n=1 Tax=Chitinophaga sp. TaxID=1869181 RepID=UPI0039C87695
MSRILGQIHGPSDCGVVSSKSFSCNMNMYMESLQYNSCLNRKLSIDTNGDIKNCPSMTKKFGNIRTTLLKDVLNNPTFRDLWQITKDMISVCKDCEFRSVCTDCRAYLQDPGNTYSKPLKCGYDPYQCTWEPWAQNKENNYAISYYSI